MTTSHRTRQAPGFTASVRTTLVRGIRDLTGELHVRSLTVCSSSFLAHSLCQLHLLHRRTGRANLIYLCWARIIQSSGEASFASTDIDTEIRNEIRLWPSDSIRKLDVKQVKGTPYRPIMIMTGSPSRQAKSSLGVVFYYKN